MPSAWWHCDSQHIRMHLKQHFNNGEIRDWNIGNQSTPLEEVVAIDGVFMVARKVNSIHFLEEFQGFHNYDLNLSFEYAKNGYQLMVTNSIYIEHFSIGQLDASWYESTLKIHHHYRSLLPLFVPESNNLQYQEFKNGSQFLLGLWGHKMYRPAFALWLKLLFLKPVSQFHLQFLKRVLKWVFSSVV